MRKIFVAQFNEWADKHNWLLVMQQGTDDSFLATWATPTGQVVTVHVDNQIITDINTATYTYGS